MSSCTLVTKKGRVKKIDDPTPKRMQIALRTVRLDKDETVELIINGGKNVKHG